MSEENVSREEQNKIFQQLPQQQRPTNFDIPVETVPLPSKGLVYPANHPLYNEESVDIKCMTANEEDLLTSQALIKNGTVVSKLLESCIMNAGLDPDSLLTGDRNAILTAIRITGYGAEYPGKVTCGVCEEDYEETFDLSQLPVKGLAAQPLRPNENLFLFTLPRSKRQVVYRLLTGKDELELSRAQSQRKRVLKTQVENSVTSRLMHSIVSIDGEEDGQKIAYAVKNMIAYDSMALREEIDRVEPGVEMKQNSICPSCGEESEVRVPMGLNFFWPNAGK